MNNEDFYLIRIGTLEAGTKGISTIKPNGYFKLVNIEVALFGKLPNKFQRYMLKKVFGIDIEVISNE